MNFVQWGCHGGGAEVSWLRRRELPGRRWFGAHKEGVGAGGGDLGGEWNHVLRTHLSEM